MKYVIILIVIFIVVVAIKLASNICKKHKAKKRAKSSGEDSMSKFYDPELLKCESSFKKIPERLPSGETIVFRKYKPLEKINKPISSPKFESEHVLTEKHNYMKVSYICECGNMLMEARQQIGGKKYLGFIGKAIEKNVKFCPYCGAELLNKPTTSELLARLKVEIDGKDKE